MLAKRFETRIALENETIGCTCLRTLVRRTIGNLLFLRNRTVPLCFSSYHNGLKCKEQKVIILENCMAPMFLSTVVHVIPCIALICRSTLLLLLLLLLLLVQ